MGQVIQQKFRAFLIHTPVDEAWGIAIERALAEVRIPWALIGRETPIGPVPKTIGPIFRFGAEAPPAPPEPAAAGPSRATGTDDQPAATTVPAESPTTAVLAGPPSAANLVAAAPAAPAAPLPGLVAPAQPSLPETATAALGEARFLVVLCSPEGADNAQLDEVVHRFKAAGGGDRIIPVIVAGSPTAAEQDLVPRALRPRIAAGGELQEPIAPVVIDARPDRDGKEVAIARLAAALLGLSLDDWLGPVEKAARLRRRLRRAVSTAAVLVVLAGGVYAFGRFVLPHSPRLLDGVLSAGTTATVRIVGGADRLGVSRRVVLDVTRRAEAALLDLAAAGDDTPTVRFRRAAILTAFERRWQDFGVTEGSEARAAAAEAILVGLARENIDSELAREVARAALDAASARLAVGATDRALADARIGFAVAERLAAADPASPERQRDLSAAGIAVGDALLARGALDDALKTFRGAFAIRERLAALDPKSEAARRDLSLSFERIGDALTARGARDEALKAYRASLSLRLAAVDATAGAGWQRGLSIVYNKLGDVLVAKGATDEALEHYRAGLALQLAVADRADAPARRALSVTYERIGDGLKQQGAFDDALAAYRSSLAIRERLAGSDPQAPAWQRDLPVSHERIGDVLMAKGAVDDALAAYRSSLSGRERLAAADGSAGLQRDIAVAENKVGDALAAKGARADALKSYRAALSIRERIAAREPGNAQWQWELLVLQWRLASLGDQPAARFAAVVAGLEDLAAKRKLTAEQEKWLPLARRELAKQPGP